MKKLFISLIFILTLSFAYCSKPIIYILGTGGTIAGVGPSTVNYKAGTESVKEIIMKAVPDLEKIADIKTMQIFNKGSSELTISDLLKIAENVNKVIQQKDVSGVVITHGTDTLEETAFFLNLVIKTRKPIVITGAMRPATSIGADGPMNIYRSVLVACNKNSFSKGVLVVLNDKIFGARDITKISNSSVTAFASPNIGPLGFITGDQVLFFKKSIRRNTFNSEFNISKINKIPKVIILYNDVGNSNLILTKACLKDKSIKGIVYAGTGMGSIPHFSNHTEALDNLIIPLIEKNKTIVVRSRRPLSGTIFHEDSEWLPYKYILSSSNLSPKKARILLMVALTKTDNPEKIQQMFMEY